MNTLKLREALAVEPVACAEHYYAANRPECADCRRATRDRKAAILGIKSGGKPTYKGQWRWQQGGRTAPNMLGYCGRRADAGDSHSAWAYRLRLWCDAVAAWGIRADCACDACERRITA